MISKAINCMKAAQSRRIEVFFFSAIPMLNRLRPAITNAAMSIRCRCRVCILAFACLCVAGAISSDTVFAEQHGKLDSESGPRLEGMNLLLNGVGTRNFLFFDFYEVALFLPQRLTDANAVLRHDLPRRVRITLLREVSAERDVEFLMGGLEDNNTPEELAAIQVPLDQFLSMIRAMGTVAKGSVVQMDYLPSVGTRVWLNRRLLGTVPGAAFNRSVLKIWLGHRPIQKNLKRALLGVDKEAI